ncbi:MAG: hypothetical protein ABII07_03340 [Patescibacteria group bacterium]|nr:hypothetical protein [Patescibacteria group bacterium]
MIHRAELPGGKEATIDTETHCGTKEEVIHNQGTYLEDRTPRTCALFQLGGEVDLEQYQSPQEVSISFETLILELRKIVRGNPSIDSEALKTELNKISFPLREGEIIGEISLFRCQLLTALQNSNILGKLLGEASKLKKLANNNCPLKAV